MKTSKLIEKVNNGEKGYTDLNDKLNELMTAVGLVAEKMVELKPENEVETPVVVKDVDYVKALNKVFNDMDKVIETNDVKELIKKREVLKNDVKESESQLKAVETIIKKFADDNNQKVRLDDIDGNNFSIALSLCERESIAPKPMKENQLPVFNLVKVLDLLSVSKFYRLGVRKVR